MDCMNNKEETMYEKWERFHNWVHCICIVTFDLELGQAIEVHYACYASQLWQFCDITGSFENPPFYFSGCISRSYQVIRTREV